MNGITIIGRERIVDPTAPGGNKEVVTYSVNNPALIGNDETDSAILQAFPNTADGSFALFFPTGICRNLIDGVWL